MGCESLKARSTKKELQVIVEFRPGRACSLFAVSITEYRNRVTCATNLRSRCPSCRSPKMSKLLRLLSPSSACGSHALGMRGILRSSSRVRARREIEGTCLFLERSCGDPCLLCTRHHVGYIQVPRLYIYDLSRHLHPTLPTPPRSTRSIT